MTSSQSDSLTPFPRGWKEVELPLNYQHPAEALQSKLKQDHVREGLNGTHFISKGDLVLPSWLVGTQSKNGIMQEFWVLMKKLQENKSCKLSFFKTWSCSWNGFS